jgi:hypothetical protein
MARNGGRDFGPDYVNALRPVSYSPITRVWTSWVPLIGENRLDVRHVAHGQVSERRSRSRGRKPFADEPVLGVRILTRARDAARE